MKSDHDVDIFSKPTAFYPYWSANYLGLEIMIISNLQMINDKTVKKYNLKRYEWSIYIQVMLFFPL